MVTVLKIIKKGKKPDHVLTHKKRLHITLHLGEWVDFWTRSESDEFCMHEYVFRRRGDSHFKELGQDPSREVQSIFI